MTTRNDTDSSKWRISSSVPTPDYHSLRLSDSIQLSPLLVNIIHSRKLVERYGDALASFLFSELYVPAPPESLYDLELAANLLLEGAGARRVLVWGDFDVDGQTATSLLVAGLRSLGFIVDYYIPDRLRESHGVTVAALRPRLFERNYEVLITCDTGVSDSVAIDYAKSNGLQVIVTDHHDLPPALPNADAIINPKRQGHDHPLAALPGVGVAYKLLEYLFASLGRSAEIKDYLDLVALGIVADVAELTNDTRYLLQEGLKQLRATERLGLRTLFEQAGTDQAYISETDIAFQIAPRLNACGRLSHAGQAVELLLTDDPTQAQIIAAQLEGLNRQRQLLTSQITAAAQEQIQKDSSLLNWEALVLANPVWHPGVLGIVANQIAEMYDRPVVLLNTHDSKRARGSARSARGYDIGSAIAAQADLLTTYGGHPGAAGLTLHPDHIPAFRRRLSDTLRQQSLPETDGQTPQIDAVIQFDALSLQLLDEIRLLAPFGPGNPPVTLMCRDLRINKSSWLGRTQKHRKLVVEGPDGTQHNVLWWNSANETIPKDYVDMAFHLEEQIINGQRALQIVLVAYQSGAQASAPSEPATLVIRDYRDHSEMAVTNLLRRITNPQTIIWAEGYRLSESPGLPLNQLVPSQRLIVHTIPSHPQRLHQALDRTQASEIVLLAVWPPIQTVTEIQRRLLALSKFIITQQHGRTDIESLAAATAQTPATVRAALRYFTNQQILTATINSDQTVLLSINTNSDVPSAAATARQEFANLVAETQAYRRFYLRANMDNLFPQEIATISTEML